MEEIKSITNRVPSLQFVQEFCKVSGSCKARVFKKFLKGEFQVLLKLVNKVLLPHSEKHIIDFEIDPFLKESLSKFEIINLLAV